MTGVEKWHDGLPAEWSETGRSPPAVAGESLQLEQREERAVLRPRSRADGERAPDRVITSDVVVEVEP